MSELREMERCPSPVEVKKTMIENLKFSIAGLEAMFHKKPTKESIQHIILPIEHITSSAREQWLRDIDGGDTKKLSDMIQKGDDISEMIKYMIGKEFSRDETIGNQIMNYVMIGAVTNNTTPNEYWNKIMGVKIESNTQVLFEGKKQSYLAVYKKILREAFQAKSKQVLQDLKKECTL